LHLPDPSKDCSLRRDDEVLLIKKLGYDGWKQLKHTDKEDGLLKLSFQLFVIFSFLVNHKHSNNRLMLYNKIIYIFFPNAYIMTMKSKTNSDAANNCYIIKKTAIITLIATFLSTSIVIAITSMQNVSGQNFVSNNSTENINAIGVSPVWKMQLGFEKGNRDTGYEWGTLHYDRTKNDPIRILDVNKSNIQPPSIDPAGIRAMSVLVRHGDNATNSAGIVQDNRAEVVLTNPLPGRSNHLFSEGDDVWFHWYSMFPSNYPTSTNSEWWQVWTQWHQSDSFSCPPLPKSCSPPVAFNVIKDKLALRVLGRPSVDLGCSSLEINKCGYKWIETIKRGHWYEILLHVKWSKDKTKGFMEMYVDGKRASPEVLDKSKPFATLDIDGFAYMRQGLYRNPDITFEQRVYHDGMKIIKCPVDHNYYHPSDGKCYTAA
jgi:hypothetical protein